MLLRNILMNNLRRQMAVKEKDLFCEEIGMEQNLLCATAVSEQNLLRKAAGMGKIYYMNPAATEQKNLYETGRTHDFGIFMIIFGPFHWSSPGHTYLIFFFFQIYG